WRLWINKLVFSLSSVFMFIASILMITILAADYINISRMNLSIYVLFSRTFLTVLHYFPVLVLIILLGAFVSIVKPNSPNDVLVALLMSLFHLLYLFSVIIFVTQ